MYIARMPMDGVFNGEGKAGSTHLHKCGQGQGTERGTHLRVRHLGFVARRIGFVARKEGEGARAPEGEGKGLGKANGRVRFPPLSPCRGIHYFLQAHTQVALACIQYCSAQREG